MALVVTVECARAVLKRLTESLDLRLYVNDVYPGPTTPAAAYTEAAGHGYAPIVLAPERWIIEDGAPVMAEYPEQAFFFTGVSIHTSVEVTNEFSTTNLGNVYGYFVQATSGMQWAERFTDGPYRITNPGDSIRITPRIENRLK